MLPGGVNSPVRAFKSVGGQPIIFESVKGSKCYDVDGNEYIDYVGSWGPAIVGHANEEVNAALKAQVDKGTSFGAPCELEVTMQMPNSNGSMQYCESFAVNSKRCIQSDTWRAASYGEPAPAQRILLTCQCLPLSAGAMHLQSITQCTV